MISSEGRVHQPPGHYMPVTDRDAVISNISGAQQSRVERIAIEERRVQCDIAR